jgi:RNA polymerase sigma-70 factor (ECF subfamily)
MQESDEILMARVAEGREDAFRELVRRYEAKARRYCYRIFRDTQVAEDAAQEVFLKLYRNAEKYQPTGPFSTWFYRVLGNLCFDRLRFEKRRAAVRGNTMDGHTMDSREDDAGHSGNGQFVNPEQALIRKEERLAVRAAVKGLPDNLRRALTLREFEGLKYREIAEVMQVSLNEVKVLIHRGRKQLAKRLKKVLCLENRP